MTERWNYRTDPLYRWLLAESADLEWQCVEWQFQVEQGRLTRNSIRELRSEDEPT